MARTWPQMAGEMIDIHSPANLKQLPGFVNW